MNEVVYEFRLLGSRERRLHKQACLCICYVYRTTAVFMLTKDNLFSETFYSFEQNNTSWIWSVTFCKKVQVGKDQEKAQSEKDSHSKNRGGKKPN